VRGACAIKFVEINARVRFTTVVLRRMWTSSGHSTPRVKQQAYDAVRPRFRSPRPESLDPSLHGCTNASSMQKSLENTCGALRNPECNMRSSAENKTYEEHCHGHPSMRSIISPTARVHTLEASVVQLEAVRCRACVVVVVVDWWGGSIPIKNANCMVGLARWTLQRSVTSTNTTVSHAKLARFRELIWCGQCC
jgi:hypothetical protein